MVLIKNTAFVFLIFLCAACLSTARLNPTGAAVNEIPNAKASAAIGVRKSTRVKTLAANDEGNFNKPTAKPVSKSGNVKSTSNVEDKRNARSRLYDEVNGGPLAFTADYHRPVHHPPKNNK